MNNEFIYEDLKIVIQTPDKMNNKKEYPLIIVNDGQINYFEEISNDTIILGITPQNRIDSYSPWKAAAIRDGAPDFGGKLDYYHRIVFGEIYKDILTKYAIDENKIIYGGYSLGGLAAVYSLFSTDIPSYLFSICGSFWYPGFVDYCNNTTWKNIGCNIYVLNGLYEGAAHNNMLENAPQCATSIHKLVNRNIKNSTTEFDPYSHHEKIEERYSKVIQWIKNNCDLT